MCFPLLASLDFGIWPHPGHLNVKVSGKAITGETSFYLGRGDTVGIPVRPHFYNAEPQGKEKCDSEGSKMSQDI